MADCVKGDDELNCTETGRLMSDFRMKVGQNNDPNIKHKDLDI